MYKPIKRLYFWLKSKVYKMNKKQILEQLLIQRNEIFNSLSVYENSFKEVDDNFGFIRIIEKNDENIIYKIGCEKFTLFCASVIEGKSYLKTFYWQFDPNALDNYKKVHIESLDVIKKLNGVCFFPDCYFESHLIVCNIEDLGKFYFNEVEKYINKTYSKIKTAFADIVKE